MDSSEERSESFENSPSKLRKRNYEDDFEGKFNKSIRTQEAK